MSIIIKGMDMPTRCAECRLSTVHSFNDRPLCDVLVEYMSYGEWEAKRLDNCPLIPVPPHGDLIDKDALDIYHREEQAWTDYERNPDNEYLEGVKDGLHEAAKQLSIAPTIIEAEEGE